MHVAVGDNIPEWEMAHVSAARMRTMAAVLRDPNPVHWDPKLVAKLGFGERTINQGPLGLSYMINMLHEWAGPTSIRRIVMRFPQVVLDGDHVVARGRVESLRTADGESMAECAVWLEHAHRGVLLEGEASVVVKGTGDATTV